jgi:hypothetical protein
MEPAERERDGNVARRIPWGLLKLLLVLLILFFLGRTFVGHLDELRGTEFCVDPLLLSAGFVLMAVTYLYIALVWHMLTREFGVDTLYGESLLKWSGSQFARYIPGTVFILFSRFMSYRDTGYAKKSITAAFLLENLIVAWSALVVFLTFGWSLIPEGSALRYVSLLAVPLGAAAVIPGVSRGAANALLGLFGREPISEWPRTRCMVQCLALGLLTFLQGGAGFFLMVSSLFPRDIASLPTVIGAFAGSGVVNLLVFFVPGGLGARDGALALFLSSLLPVSGAILMAVLCRVAMTLMEAMVLLSGWVWSRIARSRRGRSADA